ncbi:hypothetical protein ACOMHN_053537 [Nucella lapillus]
MPQFCFLPSQGSRENEALAESTIPKDFQVGVMAPRIILDDVKCTGTENRLSECQHAPWNQHNCKDTELAAVTCVPVEYPTPTHNGSLPNGTTPEPESPATDQPTAPSPKLQCRNGDLIALFNKSRDPNLEPKHLSLDTSCADLAKDDTDPSFITVTIPFDKCGTSATQNQTHIIYTNTIIVEPTSREGAITRVNEYRVVLICEMPRNATVDRDVQPLTETVTQRSQGEFVVTMNIYQNRSFQNPATVYPFQLTLGEWLNAAVELEAIDSKLKLVVTDCTASPNMSDPASPSINLLQDKCVADRATLEMHPLSQVKMGMRLQSFSFVNYPLVVIQCNTIVCLTSEVTSECDRSCNNSKPAPAASGGTGRRRRDVSGSEGSGSRWRRDVSEGAGGGAAGSKTVYTVRSLPVVLVVQPRSPPTNSTTPSTTTTTTTTTSTPTSTSTSITPSTTSSSKSTTTTTTTSTSAKNPATSAPTTAKNTTTTTTERGETSERASTPTPPTPIPSPTATPILITVRGTGKPLITTPSTSARRGLVVMEGEGKSGAPCRKSSASAAMLVFLVLVAVAAPTPIKPAPTPIKQGPYPYQTSLYLIKPGSYPYQTSPYPYLTSPYPYQTSPYPYQTSRYPYQTSPYPYQTSPYPYHNQTSPYPYQTSPYLYHYKISPYLYHYQTSPYLYHYQTSPYPYQTNPYQTSPYYPYQTSPYLYQTSPYPYQTRPYPYLTTPTPIKPDPYPYHYQTRFYHYQTSHYPYQTSP